MINIEALIDFANQAGEFNFPRRDLNFETGSRWYFKMAKRIREGRSGNNLNGHYFNFALINNFINRLAFNDIQGSAVIGIGTQREILGKLMMDIGIQVGPYLYGGNNRFSNINLNFDISHFF